MKPETNNKKFFVVVLLLVGLLSVNVGMTGTALPTLSGIWDTLRTTTVNFFVPNHQSTKVTGGTLIETGNKNLLANPSFEHSTASTSWTNNGTEVGVAETSVIIAGKKSLYFNPSNETINLVQSSTLYQAQFADGVQGLAMVRIKSAVALSVCAVQAGVVSTSDCVTTNTDSKWGLYKIPFILGGTSNGISIAGAALTGAVYVDDAFVGAMDLKQDVSSCNSPSCTPSFSAKVGATGTVTAENMEFITGNAVVASTNQFTITFGSVFTVTPNCYGITEAQSRILAIESVSTTSVVFRTNTDSGSAVAVAFSFSCDKQGVDHVNAVNAGNRSIYSSECQADVECANEFSSKISSADAVSDEGLDWISGNCTDATTGEATCSFNSGIFTVAPNCTCDVVVIGAPSSQTCNVDVVSSSSITVKTFSNNSPTDRALVLKCEKTGADLQARRSIVGTFNEMMKVPGISKPKKCRMMVGGASATLAVPTELATAIQGVEIEDTCGTGTTPTRSATGVYGGLAWTAGTWANSTPISCGCEAFDTGTATNRECILRFVTGQDSWSTAADGSYTTTITSWDTASNAADTHFILECEGQAP